VAKKSYERIATFSFLPPPKKKHCPFPKKPHSHPAAHLPTRGSDIAYLKLRIAYLEQ
jgi:hypothetical protein